jgi:hypothetical protein
MAAAANDLPSSGLFAGYQVDLTSGSEWHASVQVVVPTVSCPTTTDVAELGVALFGPATTDTVAGYVKLQCESGGVASLAGAAQIGDRSFTGSAAMSPGDTVRLYASEPSGPAPGSVTIDDVSTGTAVHFGAPVNGQVSSAVEGMFVGNNRPPAFTPVVFSQVTVNQAPLGSQTPQGYNWGSDGRFAVVFTSPITPSGLSFKTTDRP